MNPFSSIATRQPRQRQRRLALIPSSLGLLFLITGWNLCREAIGLHDNYSFGIITKRSSDAASPLTTTKNNENYFPKTTRTTNSCYTVNHPSTTTVSSVLPVFITPQPPIQQTNELKHFLHEGAEQSPFVLHLLGYGRDFNITHQLQQIQQQQIPSNNNNTMVWVVDIIHYGWNRYCHQTTKAVQQLLLQNTTTTNLMIHFVDYHDLPHIPKEFFCREILDYLPKSNIVYHKRSFVVNGADGRCLSVCGPKTGKTS